MTTYSVAKEDEKAAKRFTVTVKDEDDAEEQCVIVASYDPDTDEVPTAENVVSEIQEAIGA